MIVLAGAFLTFLGFLFAGILALVVTAVLDKSIGKERALLLFSVVLLVFTFMQCTPKDIKATARPSPEKAGPGEVLDVTGEPYARPDLERPPEFRNAFQKHTDTRSLEPIELALPPWLALPFELPPTVPGPAPIARRVLRGEVPSLQPGDGSTIPEIPTAIFQDYQVVADDLYDWTFSAGRKTFLYIKAIKLGGTLYEEGEPGFIENLHVLANRGTGWEGMQVTFALVGDESRASANLTKEKLLKTRREGVSTAPSNHFDRWYLKRSVENLRREILTAHGLSLDPARVTDIASLRSAASRLAEIGRTGKEDKQGWRHAAALLERALVVARERAAPAIRAEILSELVDAYTALRDETSVLRVLSEYARTSPNRPEPWLALGHLHLRALGVPEEALGYYEMASARATRNREAMVGRGDALTALGRYAEALEAYRLAGIDFEAKVRLAEANLRLGNLSQAASSLSSAMTQQPEAPRALLVHGAILYAQGDLEKAQEAFQQAATSTADGALTYRAQALYNLGLTLWRLSQADAAVQAFDQASVALEYGSAPGRYPDETISPAFGQALVALGANNVSSLKALLQEAREEAPQVAYHEMLIGMIATGESDHAAAVRAFARALRLSRVYPELDGWLAKTRLELGRGALRTGTPIKEAAADFEAAVAFAARASKREKDADPRSYTALVRESWIRVGAEHLSRRLRYRLARDVARKVIRKIDREQPEALVMIGYCDYHLAPFGPQEFDNVDDPYDACIRDFQQVLNKVPPDHEGPWTDWRTYAETSLAAVKHWRSLEEKIVAFDGPDLPQGWEKDEVGGVNARLEEGGVVSLRDSAKSDGMLDHPTFALWHKDLFKVGTFEEVRVKVRIPPRDAAGAATNTITFGVQMERASSRGGRRGRYAGIGVFFDRGKVAVRVGGGQSERFKEGDLLRLEPEIEWPSEGWVEIRIARIDGREGHFQAWLDTDLGDASPGIPLLKSDEDEPFETISGFKGSTSAPAQLWIGGFSTMAQEWDVEIKDVRVIRRKSR